MQKPFALKYRPMRFSEVVGQEVVIKTIRNGFLKQKLPNAYIFTGKWGLGKTTLARLIAKALNCSELNHSQLAADFEPCGKCSNCLSITNDNHPDVLELDAASRTGVGDIREIIDNISYKPILGKYRVFIIDEVHMLSVNAFNALLKTLEEPPEHVKFIFATTELNKIPVTIISRCQRFNLHSPSQQELVNYLKEILVSEKHSLDEKFLEIIVEAGQGSMRDSISLLDQLLNLQLLGSEISEEQVYLLLGKTNNQKIIELLALVFSGRTKEAILNWQELQRQGLTPNTTINGLQEVIHQLMLLRTGVGETILAKYPAKHAAIMQSWAATIDINTLNNYWHIINKTIQELKIALNTGRSIDIMLIRLTHLAGLTTQSTSPVTNEKVKEPSPVTNQEEVIKQAIDHEIESKIIAHNEVDGIKKNNYPGLEEYTKLVELFRQHNELLLYNQLVSEVRFIAVEDNKIKLSLPNYFDTNFIKKVQDSLRNWTKTDWLLVNTENSANNSITLAENSTAVEKQMIETVKNQHLVKEALQRFENSAIIKVENNY